MGMDLMGNNPKSEEGRYFRANLTWWGPLVDFAFRTDPKTAAGCTGWHLNDGHGLNGRDAKTLGDAIIEAALDGRAEEYGRSIGTMTPWTEREMRIFAEEAPGEDYGEYHHLLEDGRVFNRERALRFGRFMQQSGGFAIL